ncbi:class I SAM-dependent methyltransferase [Xanthomonas campestris pv. campestris]|nr:class I SAM-dependent methyltransferase [Xanthomonas campestris pv. campestris]
MTTSIILVPDLLRDTRVFPEAFFDLIREPILQGSGIEIGFALDSKHCHYQGFNLDHFRRLAFTDSGSWSKHYYQLPQQAEDYLKQHLPPCDLLISLEMPPWLMNFCTQASIPFLDIRVSPLRFARDLYVALRSSQQLATKRVSMHTVTSEELRLEAATLAANVRMHQRRLHDERSYSFTSLDGGIVFVGQAPYDASLISPDGHVLQCADFSEKLRALCAGRRLLYKAHPMAEDAASEEIATLQRITGQSPIRCLHNAYQILGTREDVELVGISSGLLQEAKWFDKTAHMLYQPFVPLAQQGHDNSQAYEQIHFQTLLSPTFWHQVLCPERAAPRLRALPALAHHHARETFDHWWDYSKVMLWERSFPVEAFIRSGGGLVHQRLEQIESTIESGSVSTNEGIKRGTSRDAALHKELSISLYTRLAATYTSIGHALSENSAPAEYANKVLDAAYYQRLHENNPLFQRNNWLMPYTKFIAERRFANVREVGCGNGAFVAEIAKSVPRVIGLDWARSPDFPEGENIEFSQQDLTSSTLEHVDLNCSADVLEHIQTHELAELTQSLHRTARFNFHVIACYDDGHSHVSIFPPDVWLHLFRHQSPDYRIYDISIRHETASHVVCAITNL